MLLLHSPGPMYIAFPPIDSFTYHYKCGPDQSTHLYLPFEIEYILHFPFYDATFWMIFLLSILAI